MNTKMKTALLTAAALVMTAGVSVAAPVKHTHYGKPGYSKVYKKSGVNAFERRAIARSAANLAQLKRRVWRDGKLSPFERIQLRNAERRHATLVTRAYRS